MNGLLVAHQVTYWVAFGTLIVACVSPWVPPIRRFRMPLLWIGFASLTISVACRWIVTQHPPIFGAFENTLASSWFLVAGVLIIEGRLSRSTPSRLGAYLGLWLIPMLLAGPFFEMTAYPLTISERRIFVDIHALFAWLAQTVLLVASTAALVQVFRLADDEDDWDHMVFRGAGVGFAFFTLMMAFGSLYSYLLFSDWFRWELVGALAAATWLTYGTAVHLRLFFGWRGTRLAWVIVVALPLMLATLWVWSFYSATYHHFEIPEIKAQ